MGFDLYISIEEKQNGTWKKINTITNVATSLSKINNLESIATTMGYDGIPSDLTEETLKSMENLDVLENEGWIDLGDIRIIYWYIF